ncbi:MAG: hypothetical protein ABFD66_13650 [Smithella sp.]
MELDTHRVLKEASISCRADLPGRAPVPEPCDRLLVDSGPAGAAPFGRKL